MNSFNNKSIISSLLDTDLYKLTMMVAVMQKFPHLKVRYKFIDRNNIIWPTNFAYDLVYEVRKMAEIRLKEKEEKYLRNLDFFPPYFIDFLRGYSFNPEEIYIKQDKKGHLEINIEGPWYRTILWEVPLMALISELYFKFEEGGKTNISKVDIWDEKFKIRDIIKAKKMVKHNVYYADFGTRRRFSLNNQDRVVTNLSQISKHCFVGTSNLKLAMEKGIKPIGTMAHEWIMAIGALYGYKMANEIAFKYWIEVYDGNLGIALSDTYTTEVFFKAFDKKLSKLFDGVRQDSGDPIDFANKVIDHYKSLNIDPMSKVIIFSDGLNIDKAIKIKEHCAGKIKCSFGIGTHLSNDVDVQPLNIVIKISEILINNKWEPTVKLSDDKGKHTGDLNELKLCKETLRI